MGLTGVPAGGRAVDRGRSVSVLPGERLIALMGNPNVGKSTLFNAITNLHQHTGNWPGKTVAAAWGRYAFRGKHYRLVDLPGTYSLKTRSAEEAVARDFLCLEGVDGAVVVCDATCLERNLNLVLQTIEVMPRTVVCVNLLDEAARRGVQVNLETLSRRLGVPVVGTSAGRGEGLEELLAAVERVVEENLQAPPPRYLPPIERALEELTAALEGRTGPLPARWAAARLLEGDEGALDTLRQGAGEAWQEEKADECQEKVRRDLARAGLEGRAVGERMASCLVWTGEDLAHAAVSAPAGDDWRDRRLDRLLTSRSTGIPLMLLLLAGILWLTIAGANYPSQCLSDGLFWLGEQFRVLLRTAGAPLWLREALIQGVWRVLVWVVSVMLPPMAIFFPLFTLLEDFGYLPRVAFVLDHAFRRARACGKQALTMCLASPGDAASACGG